jgi:hypothetical protein
MRLGVLTVFQAKEPNDSTTYLGYPLPKGKILSRHYKGAMDKFEGKFSGWKMHKLSPAGRLTLTKSVL